MKIEIVEATVEHARDLAPRLRDQDKAEVFASGGYSPEHALVASVNSSTVAWTALLDGVPHIMWGAASFDYDTTDEHLTGIVWLLSSDVMYQIPERFIQESVNYVSKMFETFDTLFNYVHAANIKSQQWLQMLGFKSYGNEENYNGRGETFILYARSI